MSWTWRKNVEHAHCEQRVANTILQEMEAKSAASLTECEDCEECDGCGYDESIEKEGELLQVEELPPSGEGTFFDDKKSSSLWKPRKRESTLPLAMGWCVNSESKHVHNTSLPVVQEQTIEESQESALGGTAEHTEREQALFKSLGVNSEMKHVHDAVVPVVQGNELLEQHH